jgi:hypothetical protein
MSHEFTEEIYIWTYKHIPINVRSHTVVLIIAFNIWKIYHMNSISFMVYVLQLALLTYNFAVKV